MDGRNKDCCNPPRLCWAVYLLAAVLGILPFSVYAGNISGPVDSVFKITVDALSYQESAPWNVDESRRFGTGFIIQTHEGKRILTTANLVRGSVYITVRPNRFPRAFEVEVENVSHEADLAILKPVDESVLDERDALELGDLPESAQEISLYGYPVGGESISITHGVVSRTEYHTYAYSGLSFQAIQIDAAANSGNTGSPALVDGKVVGMAFDFLEGGEDIGYLIPTSRIRQLLDDLEDGTLDGIPELWLDYQFILNPVQKKHLRLTPEQTGILINKLCSHADTAVVLSEGQVITAIDGKPVTEGEGLQASGKQFSNVHEHVDLHQIDDIVTVDILSGGSSYRRNLRLNKSAHATNTLERKPRYFIFGGFVFLASHQAPTCEATGEDETGVPDDKEYDEVKLVRVLPSSSGNVGFHDAAPMTISTVNWESFDTFEDFYRLVKQGSEKNIILEDSQGYQVVISRHLAEAEQDSLLEQYGIDKPQSDDLDSGDEDD